MVGTIVTGAVFGTFAVTAIIVMKRDHSAERRARKKAIDEATEPWRALYADKVAEIAELKECMGAEIDSLKRELHRADQEIARWNCIGTALKLGTFKEAQ